jgi:hypothetical protein
MHTEFWWGNLKERDNLEEPDIHGPVIPELILKEIGWERGRLD